MKTRETTPGKTYSVHTSSGCTVSDKNGWSKTIDAPDGYFTAHAGEVTIDGDDAADVRELFKLAPQQRLAILGVLGGNDGLPAGYKRVEWIGDTSSSQYILIDEPYTNGYSGIYVRGSFITKSNTSVLWQLIPTQQSNLGLSPAIGYGYSSDPCAFTFSRFYAGANHGSDGTYVFGEVAEFWANWLNNNKMEAKLGENYSSVSDSNIRNNPFTWDKQPLLARLITTDPEQYINYSRKRIYEVKMSQGEQETRHLLPILDELGNPGLYDRVQKRAYFNNGTGKLDYGLKDNTATVEEEAVVYSLRRPVEYGQLTERGLRRIYKVPEGCNMTKDEYAEANGFKVLVETPMPEEGYWRPEWRETEDEIVLKWVETEPPADEFGLPDEPLTETE